MEYQYDRSVSHTRASRTGEPDGGPSLAAAVLVLVVSAGCLAGVPGPGPATPTAGPGVASDGVAVTVVDVVDGDTVDVAYANGTRDTVRLLGVDSPEVRADNDPVEFAGVPDSGAGERCLRRAGANASAYAEDRLAGESVRLVFDPESERRGYYGRLLAYVHVDGSSFNHALLEAGHARVYDTAFTQRERYNRAVAAARKDRRGLWSCVDADGTGSDGSVRESPLEVAAVDYDAPGNDNDNLDEESVTFRNAGSDPLDVSGWTVADAAGHGYTFPEGTVVDPGEAVQLRTGTGDDTATTYHWGRSSAVWNNDGDVVVVRNASGSTVLRVAY